MPKETFGYTIDLYWDGLYRTGGSRISFIENPPLEIVVGIAFVAMVLGITICFVLVRKYIRTKSRPLLFMLLPGLCTVGYVMNQILVRIYDMTATEGMTPWDRPLSLNLAGSFLAPGIAITAAIFAQQIYRPRILWAKALVVVLSIPIAVAYVLPYFMQDVIDPRPILASSLTKWMTLGPGAIVWAWASFESWTLFKLYNADFKRGKDLDPVVINRFLLWCAIAVFMGLSYAAMMAYTPRIPLIEQSTIMYAIAGMFVLDAGICMVLAWLPPKWYRDFINKLSKQSNEVDQNNVMKLLMIDL